jgi:hypothetical protein
MSEQAVQSLDFPVRNTKDSRRGAAVGGTTTNFVAVVNKETGAMDVYQNVFGSRTLVMQSQKSNDWKPTLTENGKSLTPEFQKFLLTDVSKASNNQRAAYINKNFTNDQKSKLFPTVPNVKNTAQKDNPTAGISTSSTSSPSSQEIDKAAEESLKDVKSRKEYRTGIKYPISLNLNEQDTIRFTMLEYVARGLGGDNLVVTSEKRDFAQRKAKGSVILPIPAGISDGNIAVWGDSEMGLVEGALAELAGGVITGGGAGGADVIDKKANAAGNATGELQTLAANKFIQLATGVDTLTRKYGLVNNQNLELLFNKPGLRNFTFSFRLSPRNKPEADTVIEIIRFFKQGMSPKKSGEGVFLKSPDTFRIQYFNKTTEHQFLNHFKECALTACNVNYTPNGNYSRFLDGPMTSYDLQLSFTELEPLFDDDYNSFQNIDIGY